VCLLKIYLFNLKQVSMIEKLFFVNRRIAQSMRNKHMLRQLNA